MALFKLKFAPFLLLEDDNSKNTFPLLKEVVQHETHTVNFFCYEQPVSNWKNVFRGKSNFIYYDNFDPAVYDKYCSSKCSIIIDSANQMALCMGWNECVKTLQKLVLDTNVVQIILILHRDCLTHSSKLQPHLNHIASAIASYDDKNPYKIKIQLKKNGKVFKSEEILSYDNVAGVLKSALVVKEEKKEEVAEKPQPGNLSTFKIEVEQTEKLEKYKLKLPYMSKINEGESKVYYEPDAVDDWDEEDPDEDLDI
ncbi:elongator subunit iki1 domain-containing protein [Phthorimaea operculella]|nr:elongator subunit iki1 domain-containing protein [Phthorimaea operculella]